MKNQKAHPLQQTRQRQMRRASRKSEQVTEMAIMPVAEFSKISVFNMDRPTSYIHVSVCILWANRFHKRNTKNTTSRENENQRGTLSSAFENRFWVLTNNQNQEWEDTFALVSVAHIGLLKNWTRLSSILCFLDHLPAPRFGSTAASHTAIAPSWPFTNLAVNWKCETLVIYSRVLLFAMMARMVIIFIIFK